MHVKVLHILEATLGGTRKHVIDLLRLIDVEQFEVTFCYSTVRADENFLNELNQIEKRGIRCVEIPMYREISITKDFRSFIKIYQFIKKNQFDVVHTHSSKAGFLGRVAAKLVSRKIKTIYTPNSIAINISSLYKYIEKLAALFTDMIIAVSESEKNEILNARITQNVTTINSGVVIHAKKKNNNVLHTELGLEKQKIVVASVGRLTKQKDPLTFFKAAKECVQAFHNNSVSFVWIGDGELRSIAEEYILHNSLKDICRILGWRTNVDELLWGVDIFVLTSVYESFGYVTCEAMSHYLPVIATKVVGTTDIVRDGESGFLVNKGDSSRIAYYINLLSHNLSLKENMGSRGFQIVEKSFNVSAMAEQTQNLYKSLLG